MRMTRRRAVAGLGAAALAAGGAAAGARRLPVHTWYDELTGACGPSGPSPPRLPGTRVVSGTLHSASVPEPVDYAVGLPPGHVGGAAAVCLPGRGSDADWVMNVIHAVDFVAAAGLRFAVAAVDGGQSYWHRRIDGEDRMRMLISDFLPLLRSGFGLEPRAIMGWSMGGYGALLLATRMGPARCAVAIAESPAVWHSAGQSAAGAFDDADDWTRNDLWPRLGRLTGIPLRIDCGTGDGFAPVTRDLRAAVTPAPAGGLEPGGHDAHYWRSQAAAQLAFAGRHLTR